jgi:hypothetical protein
MVPDEHHGRGARTADTRQQVCGGSVLSKGSNMDQPFIPASYVINYAINHCASCGHEECHSEFFALSFLRTRNGTGTVRHLTPCDGPLFNLSVARVLTGNRTIPFCAACPTINLDHLPTPPGGLGVVELHDLCEVRMKVAWPAIHKT